MPPDESRYAAIESAADLGLGYPPSDETDDLAGVNENGPGAGATATEASVQAPLA